MCGIAGLSLTNDHPVANDVLRDMLRRITHRGPDSDGTLTTGKTPCGYVHVGFRRLAIRDLDARANQPMVSASGRTAIVFNGEVYNSDELSSRYLPDLRLRTTGDTEVLLEMIERHGVEIVDRFNGMFGLAVVDLRTGKLTLARDRMGKKPIYVYQSDHLVAFGSELRTLKPFGLELDPGMAELFLHFGYIPSPFTFFRRTTQVAPGEIVEIQEGRVQSRRRYHQFHQRAWGTQERSVEQLDHLLHDAVQLRKLSDVPLGAFLSGGVDSALVAANLTQPDSMTDERPPTFTIAFAEQAHNEAAGAAETATALGLPHTVIPVREQDLTELAVAYLDCYEQPYADTSGLVTMLLCRAVQQHVTVALSGDGGDEFFGGYVRYDWFRKALQAQRFPAAMRRLAASVLPMLDSRKGRRLAKWLAAPDPAALYGEILRNWNVGPTRDLTPDTPATVRPQDLVREVFDRVPADPLHQAACFDATYYIPDDLQVKLDRASMQVALEVRCPLLDHRVAEFGLQTPLAVKYREGKKSLLRKSLAQHVPPQVLTRPKHGFNVPLASWLRGPLHELVADTFQQQSFRESGWLRHSTAQHVWQAFRDHKSSDAHAVWMLFNLAHHQRKLAADPRFRTLELAARRRVAA